MGRAAAPTAAGPPGGGIAVARTLASAWNPTAFRTGDPLLSPRRTLALILVALTAAGCGSEAEPAPLQAPPQPIGVADPLAEIPRGELYGASPIDNLWSPRIELEVLDLPAGWNGARFAILSDFQLGLWEKNSEVAAAAVQLAVEAEPDVILLVGDYLARGQETEELERILGPLQGRSVVAVLGDRDIRSDSVEARVTSALRRLGIQVLKNSTVSLQRGGDQILIAGLDPDLVRRTWADQQYILATLGESGRTPILLTHAAPMATRAPMRRFPIVVSGNTFCGRVEVPGTPRLSWLRNEALPNASIEGTDRLFRVQGSTVLVTCGIGYGFVPLRFGSAPEVPVLTLTRFSTAPAPAASPLVEDSLLARFGGQSTDTTSAGQN